MEREHVRSSTIRSVGYEEAALNLEIEFLSGGIYRYSEVPQAIHRGIEGQEHYFGNISPAILNGG